MKVKEALSAKKKELSAIPVSEPEASVEFLLRHVLHVTKAEFYANLDRKLTEKELKQLQILIERRKKHEPIWQILGKVEFWGLDFFINDDVLVPRPETELLVEKVLQEITILNSKIKNKLQISKDQNMKQKTIRVSKTINNKLNILDMGTGAGPIICALASELPYVISTEAEKSLIEKRSLDVARDDNMFEFYASDVSSNALKVAQKNARKLKVAKFIKFIKSDLLNNIDGKFDIITANLPYIPHEDLGGLALEIHHYEPRVALDGGDGGLVLYEVFLKGLPKHLTEKGMVFCEIGKDQGNRFVKLSKKYLPDKICEIKKDFAGFDRIAIIKNT